MEEAPALEAHEALWKAMSTLVVAESAAPRPNRSPVLEDSSDSEVEGQEGTVADVVLRDAEDSESSSSESEEEGLQGEESAMEELSLADLPGESAVEDDGLGKACKVPSVRKAERQLQEILSRRGEISNIAAKYRPQPMAELPPEKKPCQSQAAEVPCEAVAAPISQPEVASTGRGPSNPASAPRALPVRFSGPSARPDTEQVSDVLRQLGAGLRGLGSQPQGGGARVEALAGKLPEVGSIPAAATRYLAPADPGKKSLEAGLDAEGAKAWPIDNAKFQAGRREEESRREELWLEFLAGDNNPVGGHLLPSPESYHGFSR